MKLLALLILLSFSFLYISKDDQPADSDIKKSVSLSDTTESSSVAPLQSALKIEDSLSMINSPFSGGGVKMSPSEAYAFERSFRMHERGYGTSEEYNKMSKAKLKELAETHDVQALLQLADRAWFPGSDESSIDKSQQQKDAINYFIRAANGGSKNIPSIVSDLTLASDDAIEAAAWNIAASHLKQKVNSELALSKFKSLTYSQLGEAFTRAEHIAESLGKPIIDPSMPRNASAQR
jgi:hypothetical protein